MVIQLTFFKEERENKALRRLQLNIKYDLGLPTLVCLDELEAMEGNGFHIGYSC